MSYLIGTGKAEITCFVPGIGMMGYGQAHNYVKEIATPLYSRALVIKDQKNTFVLVNVEQAFMTLIIKEEVIKLLSELYPEWMLNFENVLLTAQHTHSAPGGYSHFPFYNFTIAGFRPLVVKTVAQGIVKSIAMAFKALKASTLSYEETLAPEDWKVAFNRSMKAYLNNPEAKKIKPEENHLAVDRTMQGLRVKNELGIETALFNWLGVHCTSVSSMNNRIHHDNKGVAADLYEKKHLGVTSAFLQSSAGDVSPNYIWDKKLNRNRGPFKDQYENAAYNGELQFKVAETLCKKSEVKGELQMAHTFINMEQACAAPAHGMAFFLGAPDGLGLPKPLANVLKVLAASRQKSKSKKNPSDKAFFDKHSPKVVFVDHRQGDFLGVSMKTWKKLPTIPDPVVGRFMKEAKLGALNTTPWVPHILPLQLTKIGDLLIVGVPGEITYIAGERLKARLRATTGAQQIIIASYANAYMGYITTKEEYLMQCYEGGHTIYGHGTLEVLIDAYVSLAEKLKQNVVFGNNTFDFSFPPDELALRTIN